MDGSSLGATGVAARNGTLAEHDMHDRSEEINISYVEYAALVRKLLMPFDSSPPISTMGWMSNISTNVDYTNFFYIINSTNFINTTTI